MPTPDIVKTTCPRDCYDACGIAVVRRNGAIAKVLGDPDHPISRGALCGKCSIAYNGAWRDPALRLTTPLKRVGAKGEGRFEPASWDEALDAIAERLGAIVAAGGARSILHTHYTGTVGLVAGWYPIRFFNRIGATEVDPDTVCNKAGHAALELVFGDSLQGFDPRTVKDTQAIFVWGANPSHSAPHQNKVWLAAARARGVTVVAIDPIRHATAEAADLHLQLAPGTDAVLAFAMMNVLLGEGRFDEAFLDAHTLGWRELLPAIEATSVEAASVVTGVPAADIERAARAWGAGPSLLWLGQGVQRQPRGGNVFRSLAALVAVTGQIGKSGAGFLYMNGPGGRGIDMATATAPHLAVGGTGSVSHMDLAATLEDRQAARAFVNWNNNPAASSPEQGRLRRALERDDLFHVAVELFHTDTTAYADWVLPAASFLECDDLVLSYFDLTLSAQVKAGEAPGEALSNQEIFRRLAARMGFCEPELFESDADLIGRLLAQTAFPGSFADLAARGTVALDDAARVQFAGLAFPTPSGRIELASERAQAMGLPRLPEPHADPRPTGDRVRVLSPASLWQMNSSYGNDEGIRRRLGPATVTLHPRDAAERGLAEGDAIELVNDLGRLPLAVAVSDVVTPGVALVPKGRWPRYSEGDANVNLLVSDRKSDIAEATTVHAVEAIVRRVGGRS